jgi:hypothetical protein
VSRRLTHLASRFISCFFKQSQVPTFVKYFDQLFHQFLSGALLTDTTFVLTVVLVRFNLRFDFSFGAKFDVTFS